MSNYVIMHLIMNVIMHASDGLVLLWLHMRACVIACSLLAFSSTYAGLSMTVYRHTFYRCP